MSLILQTARRLSRFSLVGEKGLEGIPGLTSPLSRDDNDPMSPQSKSPQMNVLGRRPTMLGSLGNIEIKEEDSS